MTLATGWDNLIRSLGRRSLPDPPRAAAPDKVLASLTGDYEIQACFLTDTGCCRPANEDTVNYLRPADPGLLKNRGLLGLVADGLGGHQSGEVASQLAASVLCSTYYGNRDGDPGVALRKACFAANREVFEEAVTDPALRGMGTTLTACAVVEGLLYVVHVGDSRLYRLRRGELMRLTEDHSYVAELLKLGAITVEEARTHPNRNLISRALGTHPEVEVADLPEPLPIHLGDDYLLCSDGLHDLVRDQEMATLMASGPPHLVCEHLVELARERGGFDNISVGLLRVVPVVKASSSARTTRY